MTSGKFIRGVIFDLDGTLADTLPLCIAAFRASIEPLAGRTLSDEEIIATFGPSEEGTIRALIPQGFENCLEDYLRHYESMHDAYSVPFDGIASLLDELRSAKVPLAVVTGKGSRSAAISLKVLGLEHYFTLIKSGSPIGPAKIWRFWRFSNNGAWRQAKRFRLAMLPRTRRPPEPPAATSHPPVGRAPLRPVLWKLCSQIPSSERSAN